MLTQADMSLTVLKKGTKGKPRTRWGKIIGLYLPLWFLCYWREILQPLNANPPLLSLSHSIYLSIYLSIVEQRKVEQLKHNSSTYNLAEWIVLKGSKLSKLPPQFLVPSGLTCTVISLRQIKMQSITTSVLAILDILCLCLMDILHWRCWMFKLAQLCNTYRLSTYVSRLIVERRRWCADHDKVWWTYI